MKIMESFVLGSGNHRVKYLPDIISRLQKAGHYCKFGTVTGQEMKVIKREVLLNNHKLRYKNARIKPPFDNNSIDYSMITKDGKYLSWIFFASKVAMEQTLVMEEPNSEADFCFRHSIHKGVIEFKLGIDADHKVIPRAFMWIAADECTEVWSRFLHHLRVNHLHHSKKLPPP